MPHTMLDRHGAWRAVLTSANFVEVEYYYRPPGRARRSKPWLAMVWRKA